MEAIQILEAVGSKASYSDLCFSDSKSLASYKCLAIPAPMFLQPMRTQSSLAELPIRKHIVSKLEVLPCEILFLMFENLDMASLIDLSATSYLLRESVSAIPLMARIRTSEELTASFVAFRSTETQKYFSLKDFETALRTVHCWYCKETTQFGPLVNLITCRRVCYTCFRKSRYCMPIPLNLAKKILPLRDADLKRHGMVLGRADIPYAERLEEGTNEHPFGKWKRWTVTEHVLSLDAVMKPWCKRGESEALKMVRWLDDRRIDPRQDPPGSPPLSMAEELVRACNSFWSYKEGDARMACIAPLPYEPRVQALSLTAFNCQGCARHGHYHRNSIESTWLSGRPAYLPAQLLEHVKTCEPAQMILSGKRLRFDVESSAIFEVNMLLCELFPLDGEFSRPGYILAAIEDIEYRTERTPDDFSARCEEIKRKLKDAKAQAEEERRLAEPQNRVNPRDELEAQGQRYD